MTRRIFQVAYDRGLLRMRELVLTQRGFSVTSALGNAEAHRLLAAHPRVDTFLVGWAASYEERKALVVWLKQRWPSIPIVAIHDSFQSPILEVDATAMYDAPEQWIAAIKTATTRHTVPDA